MSSSDVDDATLMQIYALTKYFEENQGKGKEKRLIPSGGVEIANDMLLDLFESGDTKMIARAQRHYSVHGYKKDFEHVSQQHTFNNYMRQDFSEVTDDMMKEVFKNIAFVLQHEIKVRDHKKVMSLMEQFKHILAPAHFTQFLDYYKENHQNSTHTMRKFCFNIWGDDVLFTGISGLKAVAVKDLFCGDFDHGFLKKYVFKYATPDRLPTLLTKQNQSRQGQPGKTFKTRWHISKKDMDVHLEDVKFNLQHLNIAFKVSTPREDDDLVKMYTLQSS